MGIDRVDIVEQELLRNTPQNLEIRSDEKPSDWIKRVTGKRMNVKRK